jgi:3-hydroxyisobutyrate dehydrogenase-like beta-hydroxyacid dehydrogenase
MNSVGFIGLGLMGKPMALNLLRSGVDLVIYNRSREVVQELEGAGMTAAGSPDEVARKTSTVFLMLSDTPAVEQVLLGEKGVLGGLRPESLVVDMGTTAVMRSREFARAVEEAGSDYVDAPVSGGQIGAVEAQLTIMAGGKARAVERALPFLKILGSHITHVGDAGAGQVAKAANQVIVGLTIGAVAEAVALTQACGVDAGKMREALRGGFAWSRIMELHGQRMIDQTFEPGARSATQRKDMQQALELAEQVGVELPATRLGCELYDKLIDLGGGDLDHSALLKVIRGG